MQQNQHRDWYNWYSTRERGTRPNSRRGQGQVATGVDLAATERERVESQ